MNTGKNKVMTLDQAVRKFIRDGCHLSIGGFTINRNPMAAVYEIIRQKVRHIHLYVHSNGQGADELIGSGCVSKLEIAYGGSGKFASTCIRFRKAVQEGTIQVEDYTNYQMTLRFLAGAMGVPFLPTRSSLGSDIITTWGFSKEMRRALPRIPDQKLVTMENPFGTWGEASKVVLVPAINPDVTIIHVQQADQKGNCRIKGLTFADEEQAKAARHLIVTCEELILDDALKTDSEMNQIPFIYADAVVHIPFGAYPTACFGDYDYDPVYLKTYAELAKEEQTFETYLNQYINEIPDHAALIRKIGPDRLRNIKADPRTGYAKNLER